MNEPTKTFTRKFWGYDTTGVDAHIEMLTTRQRLLLDDVASLRARLQESGEEVAGLQKEVASLTDTSPSPHAVQQRMAKMLRRAVDEVAEMQAEARAEADGLIADAKAQVEEEQRKSEERLAELAEQRKNLESDCAETKKKLDAELAGMRAETQSAIDEARRDAQQERERLLADAKDGADRYRDEAVRAVDEASQKRIRILEQLLGVYRDLEAVPATLEAAYREQEEAKGDGSDSREGAGQDQAVGAR
jgi:cell division septum initiation protein DivIVA